MARVARVERSRLLVGSNSSSKASVKVARPWVATTSPASVCAAKETNPDGAEHLAPVLRRRGDLDEAVSAHKMVRGAPQHADGFRRFAHGRSEYRQSPSLLCDRLARTSGDQQPSRAHGPSGSRDPEQQSARKALASGIDERLHGHWRRDLQDRHRYTITGHNRPFGFATSIAALVSASSNGKPGAILRAVGG